MTVKCLGPCSPYATAEDLCTPCSEIPYPDEAVDEALAMASDILYFATGQQFSNTCREIVRPCGQDFCGSYGVPYRLSQHVSDPCSCDSRPYCGCSPFREVELGFTPLSSIIEVKVCGTSNPNWPGTCVLDDDLYHVDAFHWLVRDPNPDGVNPGWPNCSYMGVTDGTEGLFSVEFTYGQPAPTMLTRATTILACELIIGCNPDSFPEAECRLPRNVVSIARQGVNVVMQSAFFIQQPGRPMDFGIPEINMVVSTLNPHGLTAPSVILSPDDDLDLSRRVDT